MSLQTELMRDDSCFVTTIKHDNGKFSGVEMVNHPTPSGCPRWMPTYSDKRQWDTSEQAITEFKAVLPKQLFK